ncbi:MAG: hypothetical protein ACOZE5_01080 [Verrucomicrobiota bacterium]
MKANPVHTWVLLGLVLLLAGCDCTVPLTSSPTRKIEERALGDWVGEGKDAGSLQLRRFDDLTYIAVIDRDAYRVYHSDFANLPFTSVQDLNSTERKYCFYTWRLSPDGNQLVLRRLSSKVIPEDAPDIATLQQHVTRNLGDPHLLDEEVVFNRRPAF